MNVGNFRRLKINTKAKRHNRRSPGEDHPFKKYTNKRHQNGTDMPSSEDGQTNTHNNSKEVQNNKYRIMSVNRWPSMHRHLSAGFAAAGVIASRFRW